MAAGPPIAGPSVWQRATSNGVPRRSFVVALVVGPILTLINQGDAIWGAGSLDLVKAALTFLVPYVVATIGAVTTGRDKLAPVARPEAEGHVASELDRFETLFRELDTIRHDTETARQASATRANAGAELVRRVGAALRRFEAASA